MSSIIVLDSSDEDESPPKKANLKSMPDFANTSKNHCSKQRIIPSGITVTQRQSPVTQAPTANTTSKQITSPLPQTNINHAITSIINEERQTPTPPKGNLATQMQRKRKTPTPPQTMPRLAPKPFASMNMSNIISPAAAATTMAPLPPIMPMITGVHSMATPPLQLMATPPHNLGTFAGLKEQMIMNPHMFHSNLPPNTTITAHPGNPNQNNLNNNFKIHLPPKPVTTPSPVASPAPSAPKTPSPQLLTSQTPRRTDKSSKRVKLTTVLKSSDEAWLHQRQKLQSPNDKQNSDAAELTMESPKSSSMQQTPMTSPSTPKSHKSPTSMATGKSSSDVLDLTDSPERTYNSTVINLIDTPNSISRDKQVNGDDDASVRSSRTSVDTNGKSVQSPDAKAKPPSKPALEPEYAELIKVCREVDKSDDMEKLIRNKLIKYYYDVHEDFVKSKSFRKSIRKVVDAIRAEPDLVYYNLKTIVEELKVRRKVKVVEELPSTTSQLKSEDATAATDDSSNAAVVASTSTGLQATATNFSTGSKKLDEQIKKLNKALYVLTKRIEVLEETAVDWDDDDSSFLQVERFKKRACQIYEKICDLTGESKNARRLVKKPIKFNETRIPQFNKTLQAFINRTKEFPDYFDVLRMLEHCNRTYNLGLVNFEMKNIAEDAFIKVGKLLQSRRKAELYETVTHYGGNAKDPAQSDPALAAKLSENQKKHKKISDILEKYARKQDMPEEEEEDNKADNNIETCVEEEKLPVTVETEENSTGENDTRLDEGNTNDKDSCGRNDAVTAEESDDEDDDEDDEDEEVNLEEQVETLANGEVSDNESDNENTEESNNKVLHSATATSVKKMHIDESVEAPEINNFENNSENLQHQTISGSAEMFSNIAINNIENPATKNAQNTNAKDCLTPPPPNGKLKESTKLNICTTTTMALVSNATTTTTATADLKIVPVSSLHNEENSTSLNNESKIPSQTTNKSLEEIIISDEES